LVFRKPDEVECVASPEIVEEWRSLPGRASIRRYFERRNVAIERLQELIEDLSFAARFVEPAGEAPPCRDDNDRKYLHACVEADVDFLVSTDLDLLSIEQVGRTRIIRPGELWRIVALR